MFWQTRRRKLDLTQRGSLLGILNVTPDSFTDGGRYLKPEDAVRRSLDLIEEGAEIIDIGGEASHPGAMPVSVEDELQRIIPVVRALRRQSDILISIDTYKAVVARHCLEEGVDIINDITALSGDPEMAQVVAESKAGLVLMHMRGNPQTMQQKPEYYDVVREVRDYLQRQIQVAISCGINPKSIAIDPGIGFGKTPAHNAALLTGIPTFVKEGYPVLIGTSRKASLSVFADYPSIEGRFWPGVALTSFCRERGAHLFRVHEPRPHREALRMTEGILYSS